MSEALKSSFVVFLVFAILAQSAVADPQHGKDIAKRWCSICHVVESGQTIAIDHAAIQPNRANARVRSEQTRVPAAQAAPQYAKPVAPAIRNIGFGRIHPLTQVTDEIVELPRSRGIDHSLVDMGETPAIGARPDGEAREVGIADPEFPERTLVI